MWQLKKLSTNEPLSEPGPLPNNWGPVSGLHGFLEKIGDLSWLGPAFVDKGWIQLTEEEQAGLKKAEVLSRVEAEKNVANTALNDPAITVKNRIDWSDYLLALDSVSLRPDFDSDPKFPVRPSA